MRAISWMAIGHTVSQIAWFGSLIILATLVAPSEFGTFTAALVIVGVAVVLAEGGTAGSLIAARDVRREHVHDAVLLNAAIGVALCLGIVAGAELIVRTIATSSDAAVLRGLSVSIAFTALAIVPLTLLQRALLFRRHSTVMASATLIAAALAIGAAVLGAGVWALVVRQVVYAVLATLFGWWAVREMVARLPRAGAGERLRRRPPGAGSFLALSATNLVALNLDYFVIGNLANARELGLYALAFTLAFAPLTNFAWKIGTVLFPAASATEDLSTVSHRTLRALRLMALALLPLLVPAVVLAPVALPATFGDEWTGMVVAFQILLCAGIGHAVISVFGDSLSGTGNIGLHALLQAVMCVMLAPALIVLVTLDGIRGAAFAHLIVFALVALAYVVLGGRRLGIGVGSVGRALAPVAVAVGGQAVVSGLVLAALAAGGAQGVGARLAAAAAGLVALVLVLRLGHWKPWLEASAIVRAALGRRTA